jgi:4-alpha-glucanotransferase
MDEHGLLGMYIMQFNVPTWRGGAPELPQRRTLASIDTHDTPTLAGWREGADFSRRHDAGQLDDDRWRGLMAERANQVANLTALLQLLNLVPPDVAAPVDAVELHDAVLRLLADSDAAAVLVTLEDLWAERNPQNIPSTGVDRPNWVQRFPRRLDALEADPALAATFESIQAARLNAHLRARQAPS